MKKLIGMLVALVLMMTMTAALAEGDIVLGQVEYPAHGTSSFAVITVALQDDVIVAPEGQVLGSKRVNNDLYSLNMQRGGSTTQIAANFNAIEAFVKGKTVAQLETFVSAYTDENKAEFVDAVSGATTADTLGYVRGIVAAAKAAQRVTGTYTFWNKTGETVTELYLVDNETGEKGPNYAVNGFAADAKYVVTRTFTPEQKEAGYSMTISFKTESGYEATFPTLHIEEAPVTLLAADAMTGATPISFFAPKD